MEKDPKDPSAGGNIVIVPLTGNLTLTGLGRVGSVADGVDPATGDRTINVNADEVRSKSRLKEDGSVSLEAEGSHAVRKRAQARAFRTLRQRLEADAHVVTVSVGKAKDDRGEDGILTVDGARYVLQHVTVPGLPTFWHQATAGVGRSDVDEAGAVAWMREAINAKGCHTSPRERPKTVLVLDAQHAGVLAFDRIISAYLKLYKDPKAEFGFADVWLVGPTVPRCVRVGG